VPDQVGLELIATELGVVVPGSVRETAFFRGQASVWSSRLTCVPFSVRCASATATGC